MGLVDAGTISGSAGKEVLAELLKDGGDPAAIVQARGLAQESDEVKLGEIVADVLAQNPDHVARFRDGNDRLMGFFVGQSMKATGGKANPQVLQALIRDQLVE